MVVDRSTTNPRKTAGIGKSGKVSKIPRKRRKTGKNRIFPLFPMPVVFRGLVVERSSTTHFAQNFKLYPMALSKTRLNRGLWYLKNTLFLFRYGFLAYYTHEIKWELSSMQYGLGYPNHQRDNPQCFVRKRKIGSTPVRILFGLGIFAVRIDMRVVKIDKTLIDTMVHCE